MSAGPALPKEVLLLAPAESPIDRQFMLNGSGSHSLLPNGSTTDNVAPPNSIGASALRSITFLLIMYLKRPARLFRPTKVSSLTFLRLLLSREGLSMSLSSIRQLLQTYGASALVFPLIPPFIINTSLTYLLFSSHALFVHLLHPYIYNSPIFLSGVAGAGAGVAQSVLSFPVERVINFLGRFAVGTAGVVGLPVPEAMKSASSVKPPKSLQPQLQSTAQQHRHVKPLIDANAKKEVNQWWKEITSGGEGSGIKGSNSNVRGAWKHFSSKAWEGFRLGAAKDAASYGVFFATFSTTRRMSRRIREWVDGKQQDTASTTSSTANTSITSFYPYENEEDGDGEDESITLPSTASRTARLAQASTLVTGGILAGILFSLTARPFDATIRLLKSPLHHPSATGSRRYFIRELKELGIPIRLAQRVESLSKHRVPSPASMAATSKVPNPESLPVKPLPTLPLIYQTLKSEGIGFFVGPQAEHGYKPGTKIDSPLRRMGWRFLGVTPWGIAFLGFAYVGGEL